MPTVPNRQQATDQQEWRGNTLRPQRNKRESDPGDGHPGS